MKKAVVYSATRNMYTEMAVASESLLQNGNIDKVYYLIEDDQFPYILNPKVEVINISNQPYIKKTSPNWSNMWTYMVLLRAAYTKIFAQYDVILSLDNDTLVNTDISDLWDINFGENYLAGVKQISGANIKTCDDYINFGVLLLNLKQLRQNHIDDVAIELLNNNYYTNSEESCLNMLCTKRKILLPYDYNVAWANKKDKSYNAKIIHYMATSHLTWKNTEQYKYYRNCIYMQSTKDYLVYIQCLINTPDQIDNIWKELKEKQNYLYDEKDFQAHINEFLPYRKVGYTFSIKQFINDLKNSQEPSKGFIQI